MYSISNTTRSRIPNVPLREIFSRLLSKKYTLNVVFIGSVRARTLNKKYRKSDTEANVLTFPLDEKTGEIFINLTKVKKEHKYFGLSPRGYASMLIIHGILHLKGIKHGTAMEKKEERILMELGIK